MNRSLCALIFVSLLSALAHAQPLDPGIAYQGQLQTGDSPYTGLADLRFRLYDAPVLGNQIGPENSRPALELDQGLFNATLFFGPTPFDGTDRYLEIDARITGETNYTTLTPRQRIAPAPMAVVAQQPWTLNGNDTFFLGGNLGLGEPVPLAKLHLTGLPLAIDPAAIFNEDLLIEDGDAFLSLASNPSGIAGSGVMLKEIDADGLLTDNWTLYRSTSGVGSDLRLTHGPSASYASNSTIARFTTSGDLIVSGDVKTQPRLRTLNFSAFTATPLDNIKLGEFLGTPELVTANLNEDATIVMRLELPEGAEIRDFSMRASDFNNDSSISIALYKQQFAQPPVFIRSAATGASFDSGEITVSENFSVNSRPIVEPDTTYYLRVRMPGAPLTSTALGFQYARLTYVTDSPK